MEVSSARRRDDQTQTIDQDEVFARRAIVTGTRRMAALDAYDAAINGKPTIEGALRASAAVKKRMATFMAGGFRAICAAR